MKIVKIMLGLLATVTLLAGGFMAGTFITQTRSSSIPAQQFSQPTFIPQQFQPTQVPQQRRWGQGWWMTLAPGASAGVDGFMLATGVLTICITVTTFQ